MHQRATTFRAASPLRGGLAAHAAAREGRDNAMAPLSSGTSLRWAQVPHLRPSTIPATRTEGSADRNEPGHVGLQPETHAEGAGWSCLPDSAGLLTKQAHLQATTPPPLKQSRKASPQVKDAFVPSVLACFVTASTISPRPSRSESFVEIYPSPNDAS